MLVNRQLGKWLGGVALLGAFGCGADSSNGSPQGTTGAPGGSVANPTTTKAGGAANPSQTNPAAGANTAPMNPMVGTNPAVKPTTGAAGSGAMMPTGAAGGSAMPAPGGTTTDPTMAPGKLAMDECGLHTKFAGDQYCILPPPPDKGFQLHIGPSNYDNPEAQYLLAAGQEITSDFAATSGNDKQVYFYYRQFRQRDGAHHNIITSGGGGDTGLGQRIGTSNNLAEDDPKGGQIAPENMDVGISMPAHTAINVSLHSINTSQKTELREVWVNFWYVDPTKVKEPVKEVFSIAPMGAIGPGADTIVNGSCNVSGTGRMLWMYGHRHANNVRFTVWRNRGGKKDLVYQAYNWEDPLVLDYASNIMNPVADSPAPPVEGGWSGILDIMSGDQFTWECHIVNKTQGTLLFTNNTYTGEMCILDAETVGGSCN